MDMFAGCDKGFGGLVPNMLMQPSHAATCRRGAFWGTGGEGLAAAQDFKLDFDLGFGLDLDLDLVLS